MTRIQEEEQSRPFRRLIARRLGLPLKLMGRVAQPLSLLLVVFIGGTIGFRLIGWANDRPWTLLDCAYMTSITLTTVGYGDALGVSQLDSGKIYTMFLIVSGMGATLYSVSTLTAFFVEGTIGRIFEESKLHHRRDALQGHTIICGSGQTGIHVIEEHASTGKQFCVVEKEDSAIESLLEHYPDVVYVQGDATNEEVLEEAGIRRADGLAAVLSTDKDNLFLVVTARYLRADLPVVTKCNDHDSVGKFRAAGADQVVSPTFIGGMRMASQMLRPHVVDFLDSMLRSSGRARVSETIIIEGSELAGKTIAESQLMEKVGLLVVAMKMPGENDFVYSPVSGTVLGPGAVLVVIGPIERVAVLEKLAATVH